MANRLIVQQPIHTVALLGAPPLITPAFVVGGKHAGDNDQNNIVCFDRPVIAPREYHKGKHPCSRYPVLEEGFLHEQTPSRDKQKGEWNQAVLL